VFSRLEEGLAMTKREYARRKDPLVERRSQLSLEEQLLASRAFLFTDRRFVPANGVRVVDSAGALHHVGVD